MPKFLEKYIYTRGYNFFSAKGPEIFDYLSQIQGYCCFPSVKLYI